MMKTTIKTMVAAAVVATGLGGVAQAATVNSIASSLLGGVGATGDLVFNDADASIVLNPDGTVKASGTVASGDIFYSVIRIDSISLPADVDPFQSSLVTLGPGSDNQRLVGISALKVSSVSATDISATFLTDTELTTAGLGFLASYGFGTDKGMVALFTDGNSVGDASVGDDLIDFAGFLSGDATTVVDGGLWSTFGDGTYTITDEAAGEIFDAGLASSTAANPLASVSLSLAQVLNGSSNLSFGSPITEDTASGTTNANILIGGAGGAVRSDISFLARDIEVVPVPGAAGPALAVLGGLAFAGRIRRRRSEVSFN